MKEGSWTLSVGLTLALTFGLTSALPNPNPAGSTIVISTVTVVPVAAASPYPASPTTNEFKYLNFDETSNPDKASRTLIHDAFEDWAAVIQKAIESLANTEDNTYKTWFPDTVTGNKKSVRDFLTGVFTQLFDSSASPAAPLPYVASFVCDNKDFGGVTGQGICDSVTTSYFNRGSAKFHVCPFGFSVQPTKATDIKCSDLGDVVSSKMQSLTSTLVHEFMHSENPGAATPNGKWQESPPESFHADSDLEKIQDVQYGASSCMRLAKGKSAQDTFVNADSYQWFAVNAFYNSYCGNPFGIPVVTQADFDAGQAELLSSPEYNAALSDGSLAGV